MTGIAIRAPKGMIPRTLSRLLPANQASSALNCDIKSGALRALRGLELTLTSPLSAIQTLYRYRFNENYNWLVWNKTVDVARSPVAQDSLGRFYYTGDGEPKMSTYADAIGGSVYPNAWYVLGVTPPVTAMAINVTGGVGSNEDRAYVYTFVTRYGEESGPSPATLKTGKVDGSWDITLMDAAPPNSGTVSAAVKDTPVVGQVEVTLNSVFGLAAGEEVTFAGVAGMTDLNGTFTLVSVTAGASKVVVSLATTQTYSAAADTWTRRAPHNTTSMVKRIYRTVGTNTDYKFVAEIPVANTTYSDTIAASVVSLNNGIPTLYTLPPLKTMHSMVILANGALAGMAENQVCFSEIGKPYSWPLANRYSIPGTSVALFAADNSAIALTDNFPYVVTATAPEAASVAKIQGEMQAPCIAKRGAVDIGGGVIYPSNDGLYLATPNGVRNITDGLFTFDDWQEYMPTSFKAAYHNGYYYAAHNTDTTPRVMVMDAKNPAEGILAVDEDIDALHANPWDGFLYVAQDNEVSKWDSDDGNRYTASWVSPDFQLGKPVNLTVAQVHAKFDEIQTADTSALDFNTALIADVNNVCGEIATFEVATNEIAGSKLLPVPDFSLPSVQFTLVRDGVAVFSKNITSNKTFKLPGGAKSDLYAVQLTSTIPWYSVNVAEGVNELRQAAV